MQYESTSTSKWSYNGGHCGGTFSTPSGLLTSPSYPNYYPGDSDCTYHISQPEGTNVTLKIWQLAIKSVVTEECQAWDYLEFRDGSHADAPLLAMVCGSDPHLDIHPTQNHVWIR